MKRRALWRFPPGLARQDIAPTSMAGDRRTIRKTVILQAFYILEKERASKDEET